MTSADWGSNSMTATAIPWSALSSSRTCTTGQYGSSMKQDHLRRRLTNRGSSSVLLLTQEPNPDKSREQPQARAHKGKGFSSSPTTTESSVSDIVQIKNGIVTVVLDVVDEHAEDREPS